MPALGAAEARRSPAATMLIRSIKFLALSVMLGCTLTSGQSDYRKTDVNALKEIDPQVNRKADLIVNSVEFFAWWTVGQRKDYIKLDRWKDTSDRKVPHPTVFDVICEIENGDSTLQDGDLIVLTTVDSLVAPTYLAGGDVNKIMNEVSWGRGAVMDDVKIGTVPYLKPRQLTRIKFKEFNLSKLVEAFPGKEDTLWPWAIRVNIHVLNREMVRVAQAQRILPLIPSDARLRK